MRPQSMLWGFLLLTIFSGQAFGQENAPLFNEGKLFVKVINQSNVELPLFKGDGELGVLLNKGFEDLYQASQSMGLYEIKKAFNTRSPILDNIYQFSFRNHQAVDQYINALGALSYIEYGEKIPIRKVCYTPNDYNASQQYYHDVINSEIAWNYSQGSADVSIAVIDAAVLITHPDLAANIWANPNEIPNNGIDDDGNGYVDDVNGYDVSDNDNDPTPPGTSHNHGTLVSGSASAVADNNTGIAGIGFSCKIMPVKATSNGGFGLFIENSAQGIDYAISTGANIVNMSYGGPGGNNSIQSLIDEGHNRGIIFVAAAGNDNRQDVTNFPAAYNHVISVGGTNRNDGVSGFSTVDNTIDVMAPGSNFRTTDHNGASSPSYTSTQGTSFSSPLVAGIIGLMVAANPCLTPDEIENILKATAVNIDALNPNYIGRMGAGRVDAGAALMMVAPTTAPSATFTVDDLTTCDGNIQFRYVPDSTAACPTTFIWAINGQNYFGTSPLVNFPATGTYSVTLIVNNQIGTNQTTQMLPVTVGTGIIPMADAGGDLNGQLKTCFGEQNQLNGSTNVKGAIYRWSPAVGLSDPNIPDPVLTTTNSLTYSLAITDSAGCVATDDLEVLVEALAVDAGPDERIQPGDSVQLMPIACGNGLTYSWSPTTGLSDPLIADPIAKPSATTTYYLTITNNLTAQAIDSLVVEIDPTASLTKAFTQLGTIHLPYPNPAQQEVVLSADLREAGTLQIEAYDLTGRRMATVFEEKVGKGSFAHTWNRDAKLASGVYLLVWRMNGAQQVQKVQLK